jgi:hypothetical protein
MRIKDKIKVEVKPNRSKLFVIPGLTLNPVFSRIHAEVHRVRDAEQGWCPLLCID